MKLLQIGKYMKPVPGGIETAVYELCFGLSKISKINLTCVVSNIEPKTVEENLDGFKVIRAASYGTLASTPLSPCIGKMSRKIKADLIHFHLPNPLVTFFF